MLWEKEFLSLTIKKIPKNPIHFSSNLSNPIRKKSEPALWLGAILAALAGAFEKSAIPFDQFKREMIIAIDYYNIRIEL